MKRALAHIILSLASLAALAAADSSLKLTDWQLNSSLQVADDGARVSSAGYDAKGWRDVKVPTTVLNALVRDSVYPDPRLGMNNYLIPDVSDAFNQRNGMARYSHMGDGVNPWQKPYWYRTTFDMPRTWRDKKVWLKLDGINYRADVWVNGVKVADHDTIVGMFRRFKFDITDVARQGKNTVAVMIHQVDHPGDPTPGTQKILFAPNRGNAGDIWRDETLKMSGGWDCAPVVRDRNMGICNDVTVEATGPVVFDDPHIITTLPKNDTTLANIAVKIPLVNTTDRVVKGVLSASILSPREIDFVTYKRAQSRLIKPVNVRRDVTLQPGDTVVVELTADQYPVLAIANPPLWYPNGYGEQPMQHIDLTFTPSGAAKTVWSDDFAIREIKTSLMEREYPSLDGGTDTEHGLVFHVNGKKIFARGGWIQPDILLDNSRRDIYDQARLMAEAGINTIGSEDMPAPGEDWLDSWDKYGLMAWHVFHQCYRMFPGRDTQNNPDDHALATAHVRDEIKRYRNHPSIAMWVGVNEVLPARDLYMSTRAAAAELDPTRHYIPTTSVSWDVERLTPWLAEDMPIGTTDDGAPDYNWAPSDYYFDKVGEVYTQMFKNEMGMPSVPVYESLRKFIPTIDKPFDAADRLWPLDSVWAEHGAWDANNFVFRAYDNAIRTFYSDPVSAEDYARKAQLVSAEGYRAMIEAANHRMWDITTGVMIWKINSCWPDVAWQLYDWYKTPTVAYYFARKAMEPVHVQLNASTERVSVINATERPTGPLVVTATIDDFFMKRPWSHTDTIDVAANSYREVVTVPSGGKLPAVYLVTLTLADTDGNVVSRNTYWRYSQHQNFYWLLNMPKGTLTHEETVTEDGDEYAITVKLSNSNDGYAFFKHLTLGESADAPSVNPVFWSDNFVTLLPGETMTLTARVARDQFAEGRVPVVRIN